MDREFNKDEFTQSVLKCIHICDDTLKRSFTKEQLLWYKRLHVYKHIQYLIEINRYDDAVKVFKQSEDILITKRQEEAEDTEVVDVPSTGN